MRPSKPRYIVKVIDWSQQEAYLGTFTRHERARALATRINEGIDRYREQHGGHLGASWASVVELEPNPGTRAMVDWALGYPDSNSEGVYCEDRP